MKKEKRIKREKQSHTQQKTFLRRDNFNILFIKNLIYFFDREKYRKKNSKRKILNPKVLKKEMLKKLQRRNSHK